jgi:hypothetical protein
LNSHITWISRESWISGRCGIVALVSGLSSSPSSHYVFSKPASLSLSLSVSAWLGWRLCKFTTQISLRWP